MALLNQALIVSAQIGKFFEALRQGQAPEKVNREFLRDLGFKSSNHLSFIPLMKGLGFVSSDGSPTTQYRELLDSTRWRQVLAEAVKAAYGDIFVIRTRPTKADKAVISGKYKTAYNMSETTAERAAATFLALLELADEATLFASEPAAKVDRENSDDVAPAKPELLQVNQLSTPKATSLHYNIQIHLPATKDIEVYSSIFKALREHIID